MNFLYFKIIFLVPRTLNLGDFTVDVSNLQMVLFYLYIIPLFNYKKETDHFVWVYLCNFYLSISDIGPGYIIIVELKYYFLIKK